MMRRKLKDWYRWRTRFALMPRAINGDLIWLERFEWRHMRPDEEREVYKFPRFYGPWGGLTPVWRRVAGGGEQSEFSYFFRA